MKVLCYGFGFVGRAYAFFLRENEHEVLVKTGNDKTRIYALEYGFRIYTKEIDPIVNPDAIVISVPTPTNESGQDISILKEVFEEVSKFSETKYIFLKSTTTIENLELLKGMLAPHQTLIMYPEFLEAANPIGGVFNQKCKVFGKDGCWTGMDKDFVCDLFKFSRQQTTFTDLHTAGMLKYIHNIWLACNVSFWNAMVRLAPYADKDVILKETHKSEYFGTHPWHVGTAYGGACLPKDIKAFLGSLKECDNTFKKFIEMIDLVNEEVAKNG